MANAASINSIAALVRARMNLTNMSTISDSDLKLFVRSALVQLYELICDRHRDYYLQPWKFSLAINVVQYPLPADFRTSAEVFLTFGAPPNLQRLPLERFTFNRFQTQSQSILLSPQWPTMYRIVGNSILFTPTPTASYTNAIEMWYIPQWTPPASDDVTIDAQLPNGWERWVEFDTCIQVASRLRLAEYYSMYSQEKAEAQKVVIAGASIRDEQPEYMTDAFESPWYSLNIPGEQ